MSDRNVKRRIEALSAQGIAVPIDHIDEYTSAHGVDIDGILIKDATVDAASAGTLTIGPTTATAVTITPATTVTGAITSSAGISIADNKNVSISNTTGSRFGNNISKIGFFGVTPVVSQSNVANVANDGNTNINTVIQAVNLLAAAMRNLGLVGVT